MNDYGSNSTGDNDIAKFLENQYTHAERYCNIQTQLWNACLSGEEAQPSSDAGFAMSDPTALLKAVDDMAKSLATVQNDVRTLSEYTSNNSRLVPHLGVSRRVLQTIGMNPGWTPEGLPATGVNNASSSTVALATLKASIERTMEDI